MCNKQAGTGTKSTAMGLTAALNQIFRNSSVVTHSCCWHLAELGEQVGEWRECCYCGALSRSLLETWESLSSTEEETENQEPRLLAAAEQNALPF
jgi:hypothetical protein